MNMNHRNMPGRLAGGAQRGFSLIEVMIVVAIIGILAAIAYPSYRQHVVKTYRSSAAACVMEHAQLMERFYTTNLTYVGGAAVAVPGCRTDNNLNQHYAFAVAGVARGTYTVTATPVGAQLASDTKCGALSIDQAGAKTVSGTGEVADCW